MTPTGGNAADEIRDLLFAYSWHVDRAEFAAMGDLFAHAVTRSGNDPTIEMRGSAEIADLYERIHQLYELQPGTLSTGTSHLCTNVILDIDDDRGRATARSKYLVQQAVPGFDLAAIVAGRYHDTFERVDGSWCFIERVFFVDLVGDLSAHHHAGADLVPPPERTRP